MTDSLSSFHLSLLALKIASVTEKELTTQSNPEPKKEKKTHKVKFHT